MRLRGAYLLAAFAASVAVLLVLAGPAAASNLHCGETLDASVSLIGNLDCHTTSGSAIIIGHDGVTLNLNGYSISGYPGADVIDNVSAAGAPFDNLTVKSGTLDVGGDGTGVDNKGGGDNLTVAGVSIVGGSDSANSTGVWDVGSSGTSITGGSISGVFSGVYLGGTTGALVKGNAFTEYAGGYGVSSNQGTTLSIVGNTFAEASGDAQEGFAYFAYEDAGTLFSGNTVTGYSIGVYDIGRSAGLQITGNVFGGATPASGCSAGIAFGGYGSGDLISGNYVRNSTGLYGIFDLDSFNNTYVGNILTANGTVANSFGFFITPGGVGPVTMVNNVARVGSGFGFYVIEAYSSSVPGGPYSLFSGNTATANGVGGFLDDYSVGATWSNNVAYANAGPGFYFESPWRETVTANSAKLNGGDGFYFTENDSNNQTLAVTNNSAWYNGGLGFDAEYPVAGSGNTGGGSNAAGDCYLVAGCS